MKVNVVFIFAAMLVSLWACNDTKKSDVKDDNVENSIVETPIVVSADSVVVEQVTEDENLDIRLESTEEIKQMLQTWFEKDGLFNHATELSVLMSKVNAAANAHGSEIGYFDYDVWQETQDETGQEIVNDVAMIGKNMSVASVTIDYGFRKSYRTVILSKESGKWEIVDFVTSSGKSFFLTCNSAMEEIKGW